MPVPNQWIMGIYYDMVDANIDMSKIEMEIIYGKPKTSTFSIILSRYCRNGHFTIIDQKTSEGHNIYRANENLITGIRDRQNKNMMKRLEHLTGFPIVNSIFQLGEKLNGG